MAASAADPCSHSSYLRSRYQALTKKTTDAFAVVVAVVAVAVVGAAGVSCFADG